MVCLGYFNVTIMKKLPFKYTSDIAFTPTIKALQEKYESRASYARMETLGSWPSEVNSDLEIFLSNIDSFYLGTASIHGQPYIQHRGGPKGFLKVLDNKRLAFADFKGNKQFISTGNLSDNNQAFIFLMDYPNRARIKLWGTAEMIYDDIEFIHSLNDQSYKAKPERAIIFTITAWDINCPQHIKPRYTEKEIQNRIKPLESKIVELEKQITLLKKEHIKR